ncbi:MAG: FAD-dependent oxidoreductase [Thermoplasmata archaeon]|nr:FAD-dependent oxidoreductase [Thermoplasmata archaeon]
MSDHPGRAPGPARETGALPLSASQLPLRGRYEVRFRESRRETPSTMTFLFSTEGTGFRYRSNQAVRLILPGVEDPYGPGRSFSLSSSPTEAGIIGITCKMTGSPYKEGLKRLRAGDPAIVFGPLGDLLYNPARPAVFVAGGIGITPFRGMIRFAVDTSVKLPIVLLYSARTPEEFAFRAELDSVAASHPNIRILYSVTRVSESKEPWSGRVGRIDIPWIQEASRDLARPKIYVVGLPSMADEVVELLKEKAGFLEEDLEYEYFGGY